MELIAHRVNTVEELLKIPTHYGVELDIRDQEGQLIIQHDPFKHGELLEPYLEQYQHGLLIINIKSERTEWKVLELLKKYHIENFFFLDSSFPMIYALSESSENRTCLRYSEYEGMDTISSMKHKAQWVWVDCFKEFVIEQEQFHHMREWGYKVCLVSPDLQSRPDEILSYQDYLMTRNIIPDAVCTKVKNLDSWEQWLTRLQ